MRRDGMTARGHDDWWNCQRHQHSVAQAETLIGYAIRVKRLSETIF